MTTLKNIYITLRNVVKYNMYNSRILTGNKMNYYRIQLLLIKNSIRIII